MVSTQSAVPSDREHLHRSFYHQSNFPLWVWIHKKGPPILEDQDPWGTPVFKIKANNSKARSKQLMMELHPTLANWTAFSSSRLSGWQLIQKETKGLLAKWEETDSVRSVKWEYLVVTYFLCFTPDCSVQVFPSAWHLANTILDAWVFLQTSPTWSPLQAHLHFHVDKVLSLMFKYLLRYVFFCTLGPWTLATSHTEIICWFQFLIFN